MPGWFAKRHDQGQRHSAYRLLQWPSVPAAFFKASVLRSLCRLGRSPFSLEWFAKDASMRAVEAKAFLESLVRQGAVERIPLKQPTATADSTATTDVGSRAATDDGLILEQLSDWLLRRGQQELWRSIFLSSPAATNVACSQEVVAVLCSDAPEGWSVVEAHRFAQRFSGSAQMGHGIDLVLSFRMPRSALRAALALQRISTGRKLRSFITTAHVASAELKRRTGDYRVVFGSTVAMIEQSAPGAPPGSIQLCGRTYEALHGRLSVEIPEGLITTEMQGNLVTLASVTLPPARNSQLSTFAGLGLT